MADDFAVGELLPLRGADVVLGVHERVADEADVKHDAYEVFGGHGVPVVAVDFCVVDLGFMVVRVPREWDVKASWLLSWVWEELP